MNDESLWRRPRPPSTYRPTGKVLKVPALTVARTSLALRTAGTNESACLWLGELDDNGMGCVKALVLPKQVNHPRNYLVPGEAMLEVAHVARANNWTVVGAVHSHPGYGVEHSRYDDEMTPSRRAVSIVFPAYGRWAPPWPHGLGVHEYFEKYWHLLPDEDAKKRVLLSESEEAPLIDLRRPE